MRNLSTHTRSADLPTTSRRRRQATELVPCGALRQTSSRATYKYSNTVARHLLCGTRRVLVQSAADSSSNGLVLERLVSGKLNIDTAATQQLLYQAPATHHQGLKDASIVDVEAGVLTVLLHSSCQQLSRVAAVIQAAVCCYCVAYCLWHWWIHICILCSCAVAACLHISYVIFTSLDARSIFDSSVLCLLTQLRGRS